MSLGGFLTWSGWGFVAVLAAISIPVILYYYQAVIAQLKDNQDRARIKAELEGQLNAFQRYQSALSGFTAQADHWFGPAWSRRAFYRSFQIAYVYPITLLVVAWLMGMPGTIGGYTFLLDLPISRRFLTALTLLSVGCGIFLCVKLNIPERIGIWLTACLFTDATSQRKFVSWVQNSFFFSTFAAAVAGTITFTLVMVLAGTGAGTFTFAIAATVAGAVAGAGAVSSSFAIAVAGTVFVAVTGAFKGSDILAFIVAVFLLLLPLANAVLDLISWGVTRTLLTKINHEGGGIRGVCFVASALLFDVALALLCLIGLAALSAMLLEVVNLVFDWTDTPKFDWKSQIDLARSFPFSQGLLVTGMLATTLVPTAIHLTLGLGHAMTVWSPSAQKTADLIDDTMPPSAMQAVARVIVYRKLWMVPAFGVVCLSGWGLLAVFSIAVEPFGELLEWVALTSADMISPN